MAKAPPSFQFYPADFLVGTAYLTAHQIGMYVLRLWGGLAHSGDENVEKLIDEDFLSEFGDRFKYPQARRSRWFDRLDITIHEWRNIRKRIIVRDGSICCYCSREASPVYVDHMVPTSRGGHSTEDNLCVSCRYCNAKKGSQTPLEFLSKGAH